MEKVQPWAAPVFDNMEIFAAKKTIKTLLDEERIDILPIAYARGRSLHHSFIIVDESQNTTPNMMLLLLTRIGEGSKMVVNGDLAQPDGYEINGLQDALLRLAGMDRVGIIQLGVDDIVRNPLIKEIVRRYCIR
jgi:phosphate starvation-inducible PhoH-like protein